MASGGGRAELRRTLACTSSCTITAEELGRGKTGASVAPVRNAFRLAAVLLREKKLKFCVWRDGSSPDITRFQAAAWGSWRVQQLLSPRLMVAAKDAAPTSDT